MFSFCLDHGLFGFIFLSVSSACSLFVSSSSPSHPRAPSSFHLVSETKRIKDPPLPSLLREGDFKGDTKPPGHLSMSRRKFLFLRKGQPIWAVSDTDCLLVVRTLCILSTVRRIRDDRCAESCPYIQCSCRS